MSEDFANVVLGADTKRLIKAIEDLRKLAKAGGDTEKKLANAMKALEAVSAGFNTNMAKAAKAYADSLVAKTKEEQKANAASLKSAQEQARLKAAAEKAAHTESLRQARLAAAEKAAVEKAAQMESARATRLANAAKITEERKLARDRAAAQKATEKALKDSELQIRQVRNLAGNLDPAIGAAQRYNDALRRLNQAVTAGLMPQEEANRLMAMAATRYRDAEIANDLFHTKFSRNMAGLTRIGRANVTQFAYQIQDIGIQLQAGQNAMIIFAQQGSQIASLFGPQGAIVGAVIGLAGALAGFLLPSLMDTKTQIESITDANKEFGRSISELKDISSMSLDSVKEKYGRIDDVLVGLLTRQQQVKEETARSDASRVIDALTEKYGELMRVSQLQSKAGAIAAQELKTKLGLTSQEVAKLIRAYNDAKTASSFKEQAEALARIDGILASSTEAFTTFGQEVTAAALQMREVEYQTRMSEAAMRELAAGVPRQGWLMEAISAATTLATTLWDAARAKGALLSMPGIKGPAGMGDSSTATVRALEGINAAAYHVYGMVREMAPKTTRALEGVNAAAYAVYAQTREITSPEAQRALESVNAGAYAVYAQTRNMADEYIAAGEAGAAGGSAAAAGMTEAEKATKAAEEAAAEYANTLAGYVSSAVDAVVNDMVNGFKGGFEGILDGFINMLKQMMAYAIANPIKVALGLAAPMAGTPAAAGGTVPTGILGQISSIGTAFGSGIGAVWEGLAANGLTGGMSAISGALSSVTGTLGSLATAAGALVLPIAALAAVFSFFKTKTKILDNGLRLTIDGIDTLVEQFTKVQKSRFWGLSKSKHTSYSAVDAEVSGPIVKAVTDIEKSVMDAAENLGIASTTFDNFAYVLKLSTKGMSQDEAIQALQDKLVEMGDAFAGMVPGLADLQKEGEGAMEAITRLSQALTAVNHITDTLGLSF